MQPVTYSDRGSPVDWVGSLDKRIRESADLEARRPCASVVTIYSDSSVGEIHPATQSVGPDDELTRRDGLEIDCQACWIAEAPAGTVELLDVRTSQAHFAISDKSLVAEHILVHGQPVTVKGGCITRASKVAAAELELASNV